MADASQRAEAQRYRNMSPEEFNREVPPTNPSPSSSESSSESSPSPSKSSGSSSAKQRVKATSSSRTIFGLMVFAVGFALIGNEIQILGKKNATNQSATNLNIHTPTGSAAPSTSIVNQAGATITSSGRIILGGFFATALLVMLSHAGDPGKQVAVGLAGITALSSVLIKGGAVWSAANSAFGAGAGAVVTGGTSSSGPIPPQPSTGTYVVPKNPYLYPATTGGTA